MENLQERQFSNWKKAVNQVKRQNLNLSVKHFEFFGIIRFNTQK